MVSTLDSTGLAIESLTDIINDLVAAMQGIYGVDINVDSNSPDGQLIHLFAQASEDLLELLDLVYNNSAVPTSFGERLDQLVALNGLARKQGTFTQAIVAVTFTAAITLPGLDQTAVPAFTVADNAGNQFQLLTSYAAGAPGTFNLTFQAVTLGEVQTTANTITDIITSTLGVSTVNNPSTSGDTIGVNEETDAQLKVRHDQSFNLAATGPSDSMEAALRNIADVVDAYVVENNTGGTVNTVPPYTIWPIVNGGTSLEIAQAIYAKKGPGTPMKGAVSQLVTRPNGSTFLAQWDNAVAQVLKIKFSIIWVGAQALDDADIQTALAAALVYKLGENPSVGDVYNAMRTIAPTAIVTIASATQGVSSDGGSSWASVVNPTDAKHYFTIIAANITIV